MAAATRFRQAEFIHHVTLDRFRRIGFAKVLGVLTLLLRRNLLLEVPVFVGQHFPAGKAFDRDNHGITLYNTSCLCQFLLHSSFRNILNL